MFATAFRSQYQLGSLSRLRSVQVVSALRTLHLSSPAVNPLLPARLATFNPTPSRTFSRSAVAHFGQAPRNNPPSHVLFVGNLPWSATNEEIVELFKPFGDVKSVRIHTHADGRPRGFGHVEFASTEQGVACFTSAMEEPMYFGGRDLVIDYSADNSQKASVDPNNRLYFVGCQEGEEALKELFAEHSNDMVSIYYLRDGNTGVRLGRGFIEFKSVGAATDALNNLNNTQTPSGETLLLSYARPQRPRREFSRDGPRNPRMANTGRDKYTSRSWDR